MKLDTRTERDAEWAISTEAPSYRKRLQVCGTTMAYVDVGEGDPIVFLHGKSHPLISVEKHHPHVLPFGRCLAPDYVGMGNSGPAPDDWSSAGA